MSQGNYNAPPPKSGGMSTMTIVLIIFGVLGLICIGACGACYYAGQQLVQGVGGAVLAEVAMVNIRQDATVKAELGDDLTSENAKFSMQGQTSTVDFDVKGPKGTGKAHAEFTGADPNNPAAQAKPGTIRVTLPSGKTVDISTEPSINIPDSPDMPDMPDDGDGVTIPETPGTDTPDDSSNM